MMNNIKIVIAAAVVASVCSCGKEQIDNTPSPVVLDDSFTLDATLESTSPDNGLKTTIGEIGGNNYAVWSASDKIDVYDATGSKKITMSIAEKDGTYARFKIESTNGLEGEFTPEYAVYPAGIGTLKGTKLTFSTSDTQIYRDGSFADGCNVAVGTVTEINGVYSIYFKNVFSYLKLNLKATADINIYKLELITHSINAIGKKLWGDCSIDDITLTPSKTDPVAKITNGGSDRIFLDCTHEPDNQPLTLNKGDVGHFVFVVPYAAFTGSEEATRGFTLKVHTVPLKSSYENDTDVFVDQIVSNSSKNGTTTSTTLFKRSTMVDFPEKELVSCYKVESITANNTSGKNTYISWNDDGKTHSGSVKAEFVSQYWGTSTHLEIPFSFKGTASNGYWLGGGQSTQRWGIYTSSSNEFWSNRLITDKTSIEAISTTGKLYAKFTNKATSETEAVTESGSISYSRSSSISTISFMGVDAKDNYFCQNSLWYAKLYDVDVDPNGNVTSSSLIGDLVPVRRETKTDAGTTIDYGLYDNVQHKFFGGTTNNGTITGPHTVATE